MTITGSTRVFYSLGDPVAEIVTPPSRLHGMDHGFATVPTGPPTMNRLAFRAAAAALIALSLAASLVVCGGSDLIEKVRVKLIAVNDFQGNIEVPAANNGG